MRNTIIAIGMISDYTCYLNVSREEAMRRFAAANSAPGEEYDFSNVRIKELEIGDEFAAYDIWRGA